MEAAASSADDVWDEDQDDLASERAIAAQSLAKIERTLTNIGYKSGIDASKTEHMQDGFDDGFARAFGHGRSLGSLLGELVAHRAVCHKLGRPPCVPDLDVLIARLRAFGHASAFSMDAMRDPAAQDPTTDEFKALVEEASSAVHALQTQ
ncbi:hypothetical protein IWQ56_002222 [Coemansia nantahalensis]|uniref:Uncharacterized protein n=1 Tax=Coemansia helicoidea TaxID=1286919 RepID=A0ACC1L3R7_9FUNG|nr:hypothetical protein IWQ56_002222 [Coemansia nantahalensis]KAJ2799852.1 hypothetical protein H4R21_003405 [Coemansia helicoidea]